MKTQNEIVPENNLQSTFIFSSLRESRIRDCDMRRSDVEITLPFREKCPLLNSDSPELWIDSPIHSLYLLGLRPSLLFWLSLEYRVWQTDSRWAKALYVSTSWMLIRAPAPCPSAPRSAMPQHGMFLEGEFIFKNVSRKPLSKSQGRSIHKGNTDRSHAQKRTLRTSFWHATSLSSRDSSVFLRRSEIRE